MSFTRSAFFLSVLYLLCKAELECPIISGIDLFEPEPLPGAANSQSISCATGLDGPKIDKSNGSSFDFWYFDTLSEDAASSLMVIFHMGASGMPGGGPSSNYVQVSGTFSNGTQFNDLVSAETAIIATAGDGSHGIWGGTGFSWSSTPDLEHYTIGLRTSDGEYNGVINMRAMAPARYACGPAMPGITTEVLPGLGWASTTPDADVTVDVEIRGEPLKFIGTGYHDQNWGTIPFYDLVEQWTWGRSRVGPYSLVWAQGVASNEVYNSGFVSYQGREIFAQCDNVDIVLHSSSSNSTRLTENPSFPSNLEISYNLGETLGVLRVEVKPTKILTDLGSLTRYSGNVTATLGQEVWSGYMVGDYIT